MWDYESRTHRAILSEFVPEWRSALNINPQVFDALWIERTGQDRCQAWRWRKRAIAVRDQELAEAA